MSKCRKKSVTGREGVCVRGGRWGWREGVVGSSSVLAKHFTSDVYFTGVTSKVGVRRMWPLGDCRLDIFRTAKECLNLKSCYDSEGVVA